MKMPLLFTILKAVVIVWGVSDKQKLNFALQRNKYW